MMKIATPVNTNIIKFACNGNSDKDDKLDKHGKDEDLKELESVFGQSSEPTLSTLSTLSLFLYKRILINLRKRLNNMKNSFEHKPDKAINLFSRYEGSREMRFNSWPLLSYSMALFAKMLVFKGDMRSRYL